MRLNIVFLIVVLFVCAGCQPKTAEVVKPKEAIPVRVFQVELRDFEETLDYVGDIKAQDEALVYPKVSGKIMQKIKQEGDTVVKGDALAFIDRDEVGLTFERAPIESPLDGVLGKVYVDIGSSVTAQTPVALVVNMDKVKINLELPEKYLARVSRGQPAKIHVDAYPQEEFTGTLTKLTPVVDAATRSFSIEITVDNPSHRLKSGMFARVSLIIEKRAGVPVVLKESLIGKEPALFLYIVEGNKARLKEVKVGLRQGPFYEIKEGLRDKDLVVIMGQQKLYDGAEVSVKNGDNQGAKE